jgi:hypothetical protein
MIEDCGFPRDVQLTLETPWYNYTRVEKLVSKGEKNITPLLFQVSEDAAEGNYTGRITSLTTTKTFIVHVSLNATVEEPALPMGGQPQAFSITGFFAGVGKDPVATGLVIILVIIVLLIIYYLWKRSRRKPKQEPAPEKPAAGAVRKRR